LVHLGHTMLGKLPFEKLDDLAAGHPVQLDPLRLAGLPPV
jgi:hypothetical protein